MFRFFFKPKWQHRNPVKRIRGVQALSARSDQQHGILIDIATNDLDPRVRLKAVEKLCNMAALKSIIRHEPDDTARNTAQNRYYSLLAGTASDSTPDIVTGRFRIVDESDDEQLKKFIIHHSPDEKLQFVALQALEEVKDVARVAISAPNLKIREAASRMAEQMVSANKMNTSGPASPAEVDQQTQRTHSNVEPTIPLAAEINTLEPEKNIGIQTHQLNDDEKEKEKAALRDELKITPTLKPGEAPRFAASSTNSLQMDDESADALQALLDAALAAREAKQQA